MKHSTVNKHAFVHSLLGRLALLVLFSLVFSLSFTLLFLSNKGVLPIILKFALIAAVSVATGLQARGLFKQNSHAMRFTSAFAATTLSMGILKPITLGFIGIDLFAIFPRDHIADGLLQLGFASVMIFFAQKAWSRGVKVEPAQVRQRIRAVKPGPIRSPKQLKIPKPKSRGGPEWFRSKYWRTVMKKSQKKISGWAGHMQQVPRNWSTGARLRPTVKKAKRRKTVKSKHTHRKSDELVHLSQIVEHRCPYCLELVKSDDPRGVETCKVCKTKHHADCWNVTGVCQIPHKHQ